MLGTRWSRQILLTRPPQFAHNKTHLLAPIMLAEVILTNNPFQKTTAQIEVIHSHTSERMSRSYLAEARRTLVANGAAPRGETETSTHVRKKIKKRMNDDPRRRSPVSLDILAKDTMACNSILLCALSLCWLSVNSNPPMKTIEGDIYEAFAKAGAILQANAGDPGKVQNT